jgi:hypothetical protein
MAMDIDCPFLLPPYYLEARARVMSEIDEFERAFRERGRFITFIKVSPLFDPLLGDPRFQALLAKAFSPKKE